MKGKQEILYENVKLASELPISVIPLDKNSKSRGCEFHWHEELEIYYVRAGGVSLLSGGEQTWLYPQDVGFVNWCQPHRGNQFLDNTQHYVIQIGAHFLETESIYVPGYDEKVNLLSLFISYNHAFPMIFRHNEELNWELDIIIHELSEKRIGYELVVRSALYRVFSILLREVDISHNMASKSGDSISLKHLKNVLLYISAHCTEPESVTLAALSSQFGLSVPYLCRIFKRHTNLTLTSYVNELRCFRAAALIQNGASLEEASLQCGFEDYNYFSRLFKKVMGSAPSAYKK